MSWELSSRGSANTTTSLAPGDGIISTIYIIDGTKLISVTARTENEQDKAAFLGSLKTASIEFPEFSGTQWKKS